VPISALRWLSIWELYGVFGQPASVLITGDGLIVEGWYGVQGEEALREKFDLLATR
jgi:hypothetical protein